MQRRTRSGALAAVACGAMLAAPAAANAADAIYGLTENNRIVRFNSDSPGQALSSIPVQGLQQGETLVGLDVRPADDTLYAVGTSNRIYRVNPTTGATRAVFAPFTPGLNGGSFGLDVNPAADALRIVSDAEQNLRIPFEGGQAGNANQDGALQYAPGDAGAGSNPSVGGAAYTNSTPGATTTTLYDIDSARDVLVTQNPPNTGTLTTVGQLGVDIDEPAGFDISPQGNAAYAALRPRGQQRPSLYRIDLATGRATAVTSNAEIGVDGPLRGIAVATGSVDDDRTRPEMSVAFSSTILEQNTRTLEPSVSCNETCTVTVDAEVNGRDAGDGTATIRGAGRETVRVPLSSTARRRIARRGTELISLDIVAVDAAGNRTEQNNRISRTQTLRQRRAG